MRSLRLRAFLVVALNVAAVPACQHFEGDGSSHRSDSQAVMRSSPATPAAVPLGPRVPPPPRA
jgi:hypothetical protein